MIEGIEILSQSEVALATNMNWTVFGIIFGLSIIGGVVFTYWCLEPIGIDEWIECILLVFMYVIFGACLGTLIGYVTGEPIKYETQYKVLISDEVQMNEFLEKYEIVEQDGKIYTIREKGE